MPQGQPAIASFHEHIERDGLCNGDDIGGRPVTHQH